MFRRIFHDFVIITLLATGFSLAQTGQSIFHDKIGAETAKMCGNKGHSVIELWNGYRIDCQMQDLQVEITITGTIIRSNSKSEGAGVFSIRAAQLGRKRLMTELPPEVDWVNANKNLVSCKRLNVVEEYTTSSDGIRQDFVIMDRPRGKGKLLLALAVEDADPILLGKEVIKVRLLSGRVFVYHDLLVIDATGKKLEAEFEMAGEHDVMVAVEDNDAKYPIRIDPTISDADWVSMGGVPGVDYDIHAMVIDPSGNLYAGGEFIVAGTVVANHIAKWDGSLWSALGSGISGEPVTACVCALALDGDGNLYAGGDFDTAGGIAVNNIAKWDGNEWSALGKGINSWRLTKVTALAVDSSNNLYAGGCFDTAGGVAANNIAKWDGTMWSALESDIYSPEVNAIVFDDSGYLYAGFRQLSDLNYIAKWDGSTWNTLGSGTNDAIISLAIDSAGDLYAGGYFDTAGGIAANYIAKWDGNTWSALGSGTSHWVQTLVVDPSGNLYAGGRFDTAGTTAANDIAKWDGNTWSALGSGTSYYVYAMAVDRSGNLYTGGSFKRAGDVSASFIAKWDGSAWNNIGTGTNGKISSFAIDDSGNLYVGGYFTSICGALANKIAKWNGSTWNALGNGINGDIADITLDGSGNLYAGGRFDTAGVTAAHSIAKWDGSAWSALGSGTTGYINALAVDSSGNLYVGGIFDTAGGIVVNNIAEWDGNAWSALGDGIKCYSPGDFRINALAADASGNLYLGGGWFYFKGDTSYASMIARWDGSEWSKLGSGTNESVYALALDGSGNLYAGGVFNEAGDVAAKCVARWDGSAWSAVDMTGVDLYQVYALAMSDSGSLFAGGWSYAGIDRGTAVNNIARWDGSAWSALGSGVQGYRTAGIYALAVDDYDNLYAGGSFSIAGGKVSAYIAQCKLNNMAVQPRKTGNAYQPSIACTFRSDILHLVLQSETKVVYRIFTLTGRQVLQDSKFLTKGTHSLRINTATIAKGAYIVQVRTGKESMRFRMTVER